MENISTQAKEHTRGKKHEKGGKWLGVSTYGFFILRILYYEYGMKKGVNDARISESGECSTQAKDTRGKKYVVGVDVYVC